MMANTRSLSGRLSSVRICVAGVAIGDHRPNHVGGMECSEG